MAIVGINLNTINVERKEASSEKITINNNIALKEVEKRDLSLGDAKQEGVKFVFEFVSKYEPKFATITLKGDVLFLDTAAKVKQILDSWKKDKKVPADIMQQVINASLSKCNVQALILSQEVNLPPPIKMPKLEAKK